MKQCIFVTMVFVLSAVLAAGCAGPGSTVNTPEANPAPALPEATSESTKSSLFLTVTQPINESIIDADKVEVIGTTVPGAVVSVNGDLAEVDGDGNFTTMVVLEEGPNLIDVVASDLYGNQESHPVVVIYVPSETVENTFFLAVTQPIDNSTTNSAEFEVKGSTSPGAVVTVNGDLAEVDSGGSFTTMVFLEEGPNLIEVVASDLDGNQESRTLVIMYMP